jgi:hypothetical protein
MKGHSVNRLREFNPAHWRLDAATWTNGRNILAFLALLSWAGVIAGWVLDPKAFYQSYLVGFLMATGIVLGALFYVMVQFLTGSAWSVPMRRIAENLMATAPVLALLFVPVALGIHSLYEWSHTEHVMHDHILQQKAGYLNETWFLIRAAIYFVLWSLWAFMIYRHSTRQDYDKSLEHMHGASRWSAPGLLMFMVTGSLAAIDWIMSLEPHWYSTMWGIYYLSGAVLAFMAVWTLMSVYLQRTGTLGREITVEHFHDFGKWLFALTCFWAYISFSQYMLIWYGNIPEETIWFKHRKEGIWQWWFLMLVWGHFIVPFLILVARAAKRNLKLLTAMSVWLLLMEWADLYYMVIPAFRRQFAMHWLDFIAPFATLSAVGLVFWFRMRAHAVMPVGDPRLLQALEFENV